MSQRLTATIASSMAAGGAGVAEEVRGGHPSANLLRRFARGTGTRIQNREVVAHLLKGCAPCSGTVQAALQPDWDRIEGDSAADQDDLEG